MWGLWGATRKTKMDMKACLSMESIVRIECIVKISFCYNHENQRNIDQHTHSLQICSLPMTIMNALLMLSKVIEKR